MSEEEVFGIHKNSIDAQLHDLPVDIQMKYRRNKAKYEQDYRAAQVWAASGFTSGYELNE